MSNPISYSIAFIKRVIPVEILQKTFIAFENYNARLPVSMDSIIRTKIIEERVMVDCNLVGGTEATIPLLGLPQNRIDAFNVFYTIPKTMPNEAPFKRYLLKIPAERFFDALRDAGFHDPDVDPDDLETKRLRRQIVH